jgi:GT2 family glycosyltransferase
MTTRCGQRYSPEGLPLISCLIVPYNSAVYIRRCLDSVFQQDYPNLGIVVFDNHSQDQTVAIIREEFPRVKLLVADRNLEFAKGNNWGSSHCRSPALARVRVRPAAKAGSGPGQPTPAHLSP